MNNKGADQNARMRGWSVPLLFEYDINRFSDDVSQVKKTCKFLNCNVSKRQLKCIEIAKGV